MDNEGEELIIRTTWNLWDGNSQLFLRKWDNYEFIEDELEMYKIDKYEAKGVKTELRKILK